MLVQTGIPLEKIDKMKNWLDEYFAFNGVITTAKNVRDYHLPKICQEEKNKFKLLTKGRFVSLATDGTTDACGRKVMNTIIYANGIKQFLGAVKFFENEDNITIISPGRMVIDILSYLSKFIN